MPARPPPAFHSTGRRLELLFLQKLLDDVDFQVALGQETLQSGIFFLKFTHTGGFVNAQAAEAVAPAVEGVFRDIMLTTDFSDGLFALFGLLQDGDDLRVGEPAFVHASILPFGKILTLLMVQLLGDRSMSNIRTQICKRQMYGVIYILLTLSVSLNGCVPKRVEYDYQRYSLDRLKVLGLALHQYLEDHNDSFPDLRNSTLLVESLSPYINNNKYFTEPKTKQLYLPNSNLSHTKISYITNPSQIIAIYEPEQAPDGSRAVTFSNGTAKRLSKEEWQRLKVVSKISD